MLKKVSPTARFEPATYWLQVERSTTELWPLHRLIIVTFPVSLYISYVSFLYFLGGPGAVGGAWGHTSGVFRLKMLLKSNKALCLPVLQSRYEKQLKKWKFAWISIFALENEGVSSRGIPLLTPLGSWGAPCFWPLIFQLENRNSPLNSFSQLFSRTVTDKQVNKHIY